MTSPLRFLAAVAVVLAVVPAALAEPPFAPPSAPPRAPLVHATHGMVASEEAVATEVGVDILEQGGNAVDAAVAVAFALAVTWPEAGNLGGGGFMLVHQAATGDTVAIDYRERAPAAADRDMFLDAEGAPVDARSRSHGLAVGVPGTVAGLALALERYGTMSLADTLASAIRLAAGGIAVTPALAQSLAGSRERLARWSASARIFFKTDGEPYTVGETLVQADLAQTLRLIAERGPEAFYTGPIAERIAAAVSSAGGVMTVADLADYRAVLRQPIVGHYRGTTVRSMPPPSSGGVHLVQMLNILEGYPIAELGPNTAPTIHLMAEAMSRAYADRSCYLGDSDFVDVPVERLTDKAYAAALRATIDPDRATPADRIIPDARPLPAESPHTTHFSVVDQAGNAVANTTTLNFNYGIGLVADGTGVLLNNEMDDFAAKPGAANAFGLIGGVPNEVAPGKRPLSSMTPTIVLSDDRRDNRPFLVTGSPGGSQIITTVLQVILNVIDHGMTVAEATDAVRVHHQWQPDRLLVEPGLDAATLQALEAMGHTVDIVGTMGSTQSILVTDDGLTGASDARRPGGLTAGY
jgi:gamma-glutamyltranspeptidase / glutathione hydrolase